MKGTVIKPVAGLQQLYGSRVIKKNLEKIHCSTTKYVGMYLVKLQKTKFHSCHTIVGRLTVYKKTEGQICSVCFDLISISIYLGNVLLLKPIPMTHPQIHI